MKSERRDAIFIALGILAVCLLNGGSAGSLGAPAVQAPQTGGAPNSEEVFKNVQVLKGIPVDEFMNTMGMFSSALGLCCTDCHVKEAVGNISAFAIDTEKIRTA